ERWVDTSDSQQIREARIGQGTKSTGLWSDDIDGALLGLDVQGIEHSPIAAEGDASEAGLVRPGWLRNMTRHVDRTRCVEDPDAGYRRVSDGTRGPPASGRINGDAAAGLEALLRVGRDREPGRQPGAGARSRLLEGGDSSG